MPRCVAKNRLDQWVTPSFFGGCRNVAARIVRVGDARAPDRA